MAESSSGGRKGPPRNQGSGTGMGIDAARPTGAARPTEEVSPVDRSDAVDETSGATAIERTGPVTAPPPTDALDAVVATLAADLRAGKITVEQAVSTLVDDAIDRQVQQALGASPDLEAELRTLLRRHLAEDPYLLAKVRRLHQAK